MKLINLIPYLKSFNGVEELSRSNNLNVKSEATLIYMKEFLNINSEIFFFGIEETEDDLLYKINDINYIQLFPVTFGKEIVEDLLGLGYDDLEIAHRLLEYRVKGA